jgi:hypothetical protein
MIDAHGGPPRSGAAQSVALPEPMSMGSGPVDEVISAWRRVVEADGGGDSETGAEARVALVDAWLELDAAGPASELLRAVENLAPRRTDAQQRRAEVLLRSGQLREWAQLRVAIARRAPTTPAWEQAARAWVRADELGEAAACADNMVRVGPSNVEALGLQGAIARLRAGAQRAEVPVASLIERANRARQTDARDLWRALAVDAWIESHGASAGELLVEALVASGRPRAAVYVALESAARALQQPPGDAAMAAPMLVRAARLAESAAMLGEATAAWSIAALLPDERRREAQEALRDLLAERGRVMDLAVRLRADARRASGSAASAAWKGVAAVELPVAPALAVLALLRAVLAQPDDTEALELLRALEGDEEADEALRDGLWCIVRSDCPRTLRGPFLRWLGALEERAGDAASALLAWAAIDEPLTEVFEAVARVHGQAERLNDEAAQALSAAGQDPSADSVEVLLGAFAASPGAFADLRAATRILGPLAATDDRAARLWLRIAARRGDATRYLAVARRVASHAQDEALRLRAVHTCADAFSLAPIEEDDTAEFVALLLDERPQDAHLAAMLAALAEQSRAPKQARDAIAALARVADDPWERSALARFSRVLDGEFAVFAACLAEPTTSPERSAHLARLNELVGDSATLLALRTRALLAQPGVAAEALAVARRFAAFDPTSAEAAIAWFGAASVSGVGEEIAESAAAVTRSLATYRDIAAVTRTAVSRLIALDLAVRAGDVALVAARCGALADRGLRAAVTDLASRLEPSMGARLLECAEAVADSPAEHLALQRLLAARYATLGLAGAELGAWLRASAYAPREALAHLLRLAPRVGDRAWNAQLMGQQLDATLDLGTRRRLLLAMAAEYAAASPPRVVDAMGALDRIASEQRDPEARELVVGAMLSLAQTDAAIGRLSRWASEQPDPSAVSALLLRAARLADEGLNDPRRAVALLRGLLRNDPSRHEALHLAETIAARARLEEPMHAIYADLLDRAAGPHGRFAMRYRRACFHEGCGDDAASLRELQSLLEERPETGATLSALERVARRMGRPDALLRALDTVIHALPAGLALAKAHRRAAALALDELGDPSLSLQHELMAYRAATSPDDAERLLTRARALRARCPAAADAAVEWLIDEQLARGNQCWDDEARRGHALRALEIAVADGHDPFRVAASVGLFLRQHEDPAEGVRVVEALVRRVSGDPEMLDAALQAPAVRAIAARESTAPAGETTVAAAAPDSDTAVTASHADEPAAPGEAVDSLPAEAPPVADVPTPSWTPSPPPPRTSVAQFDDATLVALRAAASHGNDAAASVLAARLSSSEDLRDEALTLQRRRFYEDPSRLDALEAMVSLYQATRRSAEALAVTQVLLALEGRQETVLPPELSDLAEPPDGVARVLFPPRFGPYPELGGMLWEVLAGAVRRALERGRFQSARRVATNSVLGRTVASAAHLLQLPRATSIALRESLDPLWELDPSTAPPTVVLADAATDDVSRLRWTLGSALEATRVGHLPITAFPPAESERWVSAAVAAFSTRVDAPTDPGVNALAGQLLNGLPTRLQRRMSEVVHELGDDLSHARWRERVYQARCSAGMLVSGAFEVAASQLIAGSSNAGARPAQLVASWEPLRDLARFAVSEEYLLLRWNSQDANRRRR